MALAFSNKNGNVLIICSLLVVPVLCLTCQQSASKPDTLTQSHSNVGHYVLDLPLVGSVIRYIGQVLTIIFEHLLYLTNLCLFKLCDPTLQMIFGCNQAPNMFIHIRLLVFLKTKVIMCKFTFSLFE